jgi:hypothetical protein
MVTKLHNIDLTKDININIKTKYGTIGKMKCALLDRNSKTYRIFEYDFTDKNKTFILHTESSDFVDKPFLGFYFKITPLPGKSKQEVQLTILQDKKRLNKKIITESLDTVLYSFID